MRMLALLCLSLSLAGCPELVLGGVALTGSYPHSHCAMNQYEVCQGSQPPGTLCCVHCGHECGGFSGGGQ
jgi:hypothetical protein